MKLLQTMYQINRTQIDEDVDNYNAEITLENASVPYIRAIVCLISLTSGAIFFFACYVL